MRAFISKIFRFSVTRFRSEDIDESTGSVAKRSSIAMILRMRRDENNQFLTLSNFEWSGVESSWYEKYRVSKSHKSIKIKIWDFQLIVHKKKNWTFDLSLELDKKTIDRKSLQIFMEISCFCQMNSIFNCWMMFSLILYFYAIILRI